MSASKRESGRGNVIVLEQRMLKSRAWLSLGAGAKDIFLLFRCKCQMGKRPGKPGKRGMVILNNGELVFTYEEARDKYGFTSGRFKRGIDQLHAKGFIDIARCGFGLHKTPTLYAISERWRKYGTDDFGHVKRPKPAQYNMGFQPGNQHGRNCKTKTTVKNVGQNDETMLKNVGQSYLVMFTGVGQKVCRTRYKLVDGKWLGEKVA